MLVDPEGYGGYGQSSLEELDLKNDAFVDKKNDAGNMIGISDISEKYPPSFETEKSCTEKSSLDGNALNSAEHLHKSLSHKTGDSESKATIDDHHYEIFPYSSNRCIDAKDGDVDLDEQGYVIEGILRLEVEEATGFATTENSIRGITSQGTVPEVWNSPKCIKTVGEVEIEDIHDIELEKSSEEELSELPDTEDDKTNHL